MENYNHIKYYGKITILLVVVFIILKFIINLKTWEALLLSAIIITSILIIENIITINQSVEDPLNCNKCKVSTFKKKETFNNYDSNTNDTSNIIID